MELNITTSKLASFVYARDNERTPEEYFAEFTDPQISARGRATMLLSNLTAENLSSYTTVNGEIAGNNLLVTPQATGVLREYLATVRGAFPIQETKVYEIDGLRVNFKTAQFWLNPDDLQYIYRRVSTREPDIFEELAFTTFGLISEGSLRYDYLSYNLSTKDIITKIEAYPNYTVYYPSDYHLERIESELNDMVGYFIHHDKLGLLTG